jgi:phosphoglycolate phosphatase-like HAD superfamily hydrolase
MKSGRVLVTFDVDGTLVRSTGADANYFHKEAFRRAHVAVHGHRADISIDVIKHHGCTDPMVSARTLGAAGINAEEAAAKWPAVAAEMVAFVKENEHQANVGLDVLGGVGALLQQLKSRGALTGLVTGNLQPIAWAKMKALGLQEHFTTPNFGGFGSDHSDRGELVKIASLRARELFPDEEIAVHWHVGDTPADVVAAGYGGARALGVCTGVFTREELMDACAATDVVVHDLTQTDALLDLLLRS